MVVVYGDAWLLVGIRLHHVDGRRCARSVWAAGILEAIFMVLGGRRFRVHVIRELGSVGGMRCVHSLIRGRGARQGFGGGGGLVVHPLHCQVTLVEVEGAVIAA